MSGEILYIYVGDEKQPIDEKRIISFIEIAEPFIKWLRANPDQKHFHSKLAENINRGRWNIDAMGDIEATGTELLRRLNHDRERNISNKYKEKIAMIVRDAYRLIYNT